MADTSIAYKVKSERVHLPSIVTRDKVDLGLVQETRKLHVVGSLDPLETSEGTVRDDTRTVAGLGAPSNHLAFNLADLLALHRGSPETEICKSALVSPCLPCSLGRRTIEAVEVSSLAHGFLVLGRAVTDVVAGLTTTGEMGLSVHLIGLLVGLLSVFEERRRNEKTHEVGEGVVLVIQGNFTTDVLSALRRDVRKTVQSKERKEWKQTSE